MKKLSYKNLEFFFFILYFGKKHEIMKLSDFISGCNFHGF